MNKSARRNAFGVVGMCASLAIFGAVGAARGDDDEGTRYAPRHPAYRAECGGCHVAYSPTMLSSSAWRTLMSKLDKHFGTDASVEEPVRTEIAAFLEAASSRRPSLDPQGREVLRISQTAWFLREHRPGREGIPYGIFESPVVRSAANCESCHRAAADGDYGEDSIRIPPLSQSARRSEVPETSNLKGRAR